MHWTPVDTQSKLFADELQRRGVKKVAIFGENNDSSIAAIDSFKKNSEGTGIEVVWAENFNKGETDFRTMIIKNI